MLNRVVIEFPDDIVVVPGPHGKGLHFVTNSAVLTADYGREGDTAFIRDTGMEWVKTGGVWAATGEQFLNGLLPTVITARDEAVDARDIAVDRADQTGQDRVVTGENREAVRLDREQTGEDRTATGEDREAAALSANLAMRWANEEPGTPVADGLYSGRHWAGVGEYWATRPAVLTVAVNIDGIVLVSGSVAAVGVVAADIAAVQIAAANMAAILAAPGAATTASTAAGTATGAANTAVAARDKAQKWADENENTEVEAGKYSARHWAAKSATSAATAVNATLIAYGVAIYKAAGIDLGGYYADRRAANNSLHDRWVLEILDGDPGCSADLYVEVAGAMVYGPVTVAFGAPVNLSGLAIAVTAGNSVGFVMTSRVGAVRDLFCALYGKVS